MKVRGQHGSGVGGILRTIWFCASQGSRLLVCLCVNRRKRSSYMGSPRVEGYTTLNLPNWTALHSKNCVIDFKSALNNLINLHIPLYPVLKELQWKERNAFI